MKKILKTILAATIAVAMIMSVLACGETPTEATKEATQEETTTAAPETTAEPSSDTVPEETKLEGKELLKWYANEYIRITDGKELAKYDAAVADYETKSQEKGKIIFFGSSHFTRWKKSYGAERELEEDMASESGETVCLNHGIGGSNIAHNIYYYKRMVKNYEPKALCLSVLFNYTTDYNFTFDEVFLMIEYFLEMARQDFPGIQFYLIVDHSAENKKDLVAMLEEYVKEYTDTHLVELNFQERYDAHPEDHPNSNDMRADLYVEDNVHYTVLGYKYFTQIWREALADYLK